jgi:hypothetical protein
MSDRPDMPGTPEPPEWFKTGRWIFHVVFGDPAVIRSTWRSILLIAGLLSLGFWFLDRSRLEDQIINLRSVNETLNATIQLQNTRIAGLEFHGDQPSQKKTAETPSETSNKYVCTSRITASTAGKQAILIEFGVHQNPSNGMVGYVGVSGRYTDVRHWEGQPLRTDIPSSFGGMYGDFGETKGDQTYTIRFRTPQITPVQSEFVYIESDQPISIQQVLYLDDVFLLNDPMKADRSASQFGDCPRR